MDGSPWDIIAPALGIALSPFPIIGAILFLIGLSQIAGGPEGLR